MQVRGRSEGCNVGKPQTSVATWRETDRLSILHACLCRGNIPIVSRALDARHVPFPTHTCTAQQTPALHRLHTSIKASPGTSRSPEAASTCQSPCLPPPPPLLRTRRQTHPPKPLHSVLPISRTEPATIHCAQLSQTTQSRPSETTRPVAICSRQPPPFAGARRLAGHHLGEE